MDSFRRLMISAASMVGGVRRNLHQRSPQHVACPRPTRAADSGISLVAGAESHSHLYHASFLSRSYSL
jgi:hypothetical protein